MPVLNLILIFFLFLTSKRCRPESHQFRRGGIPLRFPAAATLPRLTSDSASRMRWGRLRWPRYTYPTHINNYLPTSECRRRRRRRRRQTTTNNAANTRELQAPPPRPFLLHLLDAFTCVRRCVMHPATSDSRPLHA